MPPIDPQRYRQKVSSIDTSTRLLGLTGFPVSAAQETDKGQDSMAYRIEAVMHHPYPGKRLHNTLHALIGYAAAHGRLDPDKLSIQVEGQPQADGDGRYRQWIRLHFHHCGRFEINDMIRELVQAAKHMTHQSLGTSSVRELRRRALGSEADPVRHK